MQNIVSQRLGTQGLLQQPFKTPTEVVAWLGAVQSQDYSGAVWAIGQRIAGAKEALVEQAMIDGAIIRTHILRPTWHFVAPADLRWMLTATSHRVHGLNSTYYRKMELDEAVFARSHEILTALLQGNQYRTRTEIAAAYKQAGINANELRLAYLVMQAELEGLICSGPRRGKQFTYALVGERVPSAPSLPFDEALAKLTRAYFTGHGPATVQDFMRWSSLTQAEVRHGLDMLSGQLEHDSMDGMTYYWGAAPYSTAFTAPLAHLLPNYDECLGGYRGSLSVEEQYRRIWADGAIVYGHYLVIDGMVIGLWKRDLKKASVLITAKPFRSLTEPEIAAIQQAAQHFGQFWGLEAEIVFEEAAI
jgi:hypothetical protein